MFRTDIFTHVTYYTHRDRGQNNFKLLPRYVEKRLMENTFVIFLDINVQHHTHLYTNHISNTALIYARINYECL